MNKLVISLSGEVSVKGSNSLESFWNGFINIQRSICDIDDLQIVGHSMNPEYDDLVKNVYGISLLSSDAIENNISSRGIPNIHLDLGKISSKNKSLTEVEKLNIDNNTFVLSTTWDSGWNNSQYIKPIIFDNSLPKMYFYLAYHDNVDEGYSTSWCYSSYENIKYLCEYEENLVKKLSSDSTYLQKYMAQSWPLAIKQNKNRFDLVKRMIFTSLDENINFQLIRRFIPFLSKRVDGLEYRLKKVLEKPIFTGENSLLTCSNTSVHLSDFGENISAASFLKLSVFESGHRKKTRFLHESDFERLDEGQMINPITFACVIHTHSRHSVCWDGMLEQALLHLPENCNQIYLIAENSSETAIAFASLKHKDIELVTINEESNLARELHNVFFKINNEVDYIYFMPDNMPLISNVDAVYLSSLLHFLESTDEQHVQLTVRPNLSEESSKGSFPNLVKQGSVCPLFSHPVILNTHLLLNQLLSKDIEIPNIAGLLMGNDIPYSVVYERLGSEAGLCLFPHVKINIPLDGDAENEWLKSIEFEANENEKLKSRLINE